MEAFAGLMVFLALCGKRVIGLGAMTIFGELARLRFVNQPLVFAADALSGDSLPLPVNLAGGTADLLGLS